MYILLKYDVKWLEKLLGVVKYSQYYTIIPISKSGVLSVIVGDNNSFLRHSWQPFSLKILARCLLKIQNLPQTSVLHQSAENAPLGIVSLL